MLAMEIDGLPSALVDDRRVNGAMPASVYLRAVERALRGTVTYEAPPPPGIDSHASSGLAAVVFRTEPVNLGPERIEVES